MIYAHAHGRLNDIHTVVVVVSIFKRFTSRFFEMSFLLLLFLLVFSYISFYILSRANFEVLHFVFFTASSFFLYFRYHIAVFSIVFLSLPIAHPWRFIALLFFTSFVYRCNDVYRYAPTQLRLRLPPGYPGLSWVSSMVNLRSDCSARKRFSQSYS